MRRFEVSSLIYFADFHRIFVLKLSSIVRPLSIPTCTDSIMDQDTSSTMNQETSNIMDQDTSTARDSPRQVRIQSSVLQCFNCSSYSQVSTSTPLEHHPNQFNKSTMGSRLTGNLPTTYPQKNTTRVELTPGHPSFQSSSSSSALSPPG